MTSTMSLQQGLGRWRHGQQSAQHVGRGQCRAPMTPALEGRSVGHMPTRRAPFGTEEAVKRTPRGISGAFAGRADASSSSASSTSSCGARGAVAFWHLSAPPIASTEGVCFALSASLCCCSTSAVRCGL